MITYDGSLGGTVTLDPKYEMNNVVIKVSITDLNNPTTKSTRTQDFKLNFVHGSCATADGSMNIL
jgi:hypothetical protein